MEDFQLRDILRHRNHHDGEGNRVLRRRRHGGKCGCHGASVLVEEWWEGGKHRKKKQNNKLVDLKRVKKRVKYYMSCFFDQGLIHEDMD